MTGLFKPLELLWRGVNRARRSLYQAGLLRSRRLPRPVISIGNIAVGGSGKTPVTISVARELVALGKRVAILTRGYGRTSRDRTLVVDSNDASRFGDEPIVLRQSVPGVQVVVGADRWSSGMSYLESHDCDVFILDDGFQHLRLARDLDIVIEQPDARWLRDSPRALESAEIVLTRSDDTAAGSRRQFRVIIEPVSARLGSDELPLERIRGASVFAFAGLARNEQFFETLGRLGADLRGTRSFPDHHVYERSDVEGLRRDAASRGAGLILTTRKDFVKIGAEDIGVVDVEARIEPRREFLDRIGSVFG